MTAYPAELRRWLMRDLVPRILPFSDAATAHGGLSDRALPALRLGRRAHR